MTTIAYDGITLAADSQITWGNIRMPRPSCKIHIISPTRVAASSGPSAECFKLVEWLRAGAQPTDTLKLTDNPLLLICDSSGEVWTLDNDLVLLPDEAPATIGSGADIARGAMHAGATALEAVRIAARVDISTSEPIYTFDWLSLKIRKAPTSKKPLYGSRVNNK